MSTFEDGLGGSRRDREPEALGLLGGSGLYDLPGLTDVREDHVDTPFGSPSGPVVSGRIGGRRVMFLARHGRGHRLSPSEINYRANVHALKQMGAVRLVSISAVGSLREGIAPGDLVLVDQFIDKTHLRATTFFDRGIVGHVSFGDPTCPDLVGRLGAAAEAVGIGSLSRDRRGTAPQPGRAPGLHVGGTYVCMEGPQFSTRAESLLHRSWGADVVGMTASPEAKLAREAELCFAVVALATDYDCWHPAEAAVTAGSVVEVLRGNIARAVAVVGRLLADLPVRDPKAGSGSGSTCGCAQAAEHAVLTAREAITPEARERLRVLYGRYL